MARSEDLERQRVRYVFSESMRDNALGVSAGVPPGGPPGMFPARVGEWRAVVRVLRSPASLFTSAVDDLVATVFPANCRACGGSLLRSASAPLCLPVCGTCLARLLPQSQSILTSLCRCCGESLGMESDRLTPAEGLLCTPCRIAPPEFLRAVAYGVYEDELREMTHLLKYDRVHSIAGPLGAMLAEAIGLLNHEPEWSGDVTVVAVPLFSTKQRQRGFNQSLHLADQALSVLRKRHPAWRMTAAHGLLRRVKDTESQFNLSPRGRRRNLEGAFEATRDPALLIGRDVLLIDDIYTTGATARACSRVLRRAGARRVWVATLARAQRERVALWDASEREFG